VAVVVRVQWEQTLQVVQFLAMAAMVQQATLAEQALFMLAVEVVAVMVAALLELAVLVAVASEAALVTAQMEPPIEAVEAAALTMAVLAVLAALVLLSLNLVVENGTFCKN
jgi:hypothetical protein